MAAQSAHLSAQLPKAACNRSLPAINGLRRLGSNGQRAGGAQPVQSSRFASALSLPIGLRGPARISSPVVAATSYENGFGSVGKPDDQLDRPAVDSATVQATNSSTPAAQSQSTQSPADPGAADVLLKATENSDVDVTQSYNGEA